MKKSAVLLPVCAISLFAGRAVAQTVPAAEPGATIRTTATEVALDVVVVDKHGKNVRTLKPADLEVYEDGVQQSVTSFRLVATREVQAPQGSAPVPRAAPATEISRPLRGVNMICIVYHNISPVVRLNATHAVQEFLKNELPPDTYIGMFLLSDHLTPILSFTKDRAKVSQAAENAFTLTPLDFSSASVGVLTANPNMQTITITGTATGGGSANINVTGGELPNTVIAGADVTNAPGANALRGAQVTENRDFAELTGARAEDEIANLIKTLGALPGRKTVLMVTQGLLTTGDPERLQAMLTKANANGVTLYPLDITGLTETSTAQAANLKLGAVGKQSANQANVTSLQGTMASTTSAGVTTSTAINLDAMKEQSREGDTLAYGVRASDTQASLRALAEGTGGFMIANSQDYAKPFSRIMDNIEAHYEVVYRPTENKYDGRLRKIQVKLRGRAAEYHVESRTGYFAMPDLKGSSVLQAFEIMGLSALSATPQPRSFDFHTAAFHFQDAGANARGAQLYFELPGEALKAVPGANQTREMHASLVALVKDSTGQVVDKYSNDQVYNLPDAKLKDLKAVPIEYTHAVNLPAGHYTVEAAVVDREAGLASTSSTEFDNVEAKGFGLGNITMIQRIESADKPDPADPLVFAGKHLVPLLERTLHADTPYMLYFEVYPDRSSMKRLEAQVEVTSSGKVLESKPAKLTWDAGAWKALVEAPAQPGSYEVKVTASQGSLPAASQTLRYTVVQ